MLLGAFNETSRAPKRQEQLQDMRSNILTCGNQETYGINYPKSKTPFFSPQIRRKKTGVLRGCCRDKGPKNICWALGLVQEEFVVQGQINSNEDVRLRTP